MKIERHYIPKSSLEDFVNSHGLTMVITERDNGHYHARIKGAERKEEGCLVSEFGVGNTEDSAMKDYMDKISNEILVFNAFSTNRKEIKVPLLTRVWNKKIEEGEE